MFQGIIQFEKKNWIMKRLIDVTASLIGLVFLSPFLVLIAIIIKRDTPGPVFYKGLRSGKGGGTFNIMKFRTMFSNPDSFNGAKVTAEDDPRITVAGKWLRDTKLNELPQLWNVLKGEMSLVGPRPEDPDIVANWTQEERDEILSVRPGITSPATVLFRDEEALLNHDQLMEIYLSSIAPSKIRLDQLYIRYYSIWLDIDTVVWTLSIFLPKINSYELQESELLFGPLHRFTTRYFYWFTIDFITVLLSFGIAGLFWRSLGPLDIGWGPALVIAFGFSLLFSVIGAFTGIQKIFWSKASAGDVIELIYTATIAFIASIMINEYYSILPYQLVMIASILSFAGFLCVRYRSRLITGFASRWIQLRGGGKFVSERILIVGCGEAGQFAAWMFENSSSSAQYQIVGYADDDITKQGSRIQGVKVVGRGEDIHRLVEENDVGIIIYAIHNIAPENQNAILETCHSTQAQVLIFPDVMQSLSIASENNINFGRRSSDHGWNDTGIALIPDNQMESISEGLRQLSIDLEEGKINQGKERVRRLREQLGDIPQKNGAMLSTAKYFDE